MSKKSSFEQTRPYFSKRYKREPAPRNAVRFARTILLVLLLGLVVAVVWSIAAH